MALSDLVNRPRTVVGAVAAAVVVTTLFVGAIGLTMRLVGSGWAFDGRNAPIWILGFFGCNALFTAIALVQKAREDNRKPPPAPDERHRFAGPGRT
jgi:hypothetical protein